MTHNVLPTPFADLEPFVDWALPTERERNRKRLSSSMDVLRAFHQAILPRVPTIIEYLNDSRPDTFFLLNGDIELNRYREPFVQKVLKELQS